MTQRETVDFELETALREAGALLDTTSFGVLCTISKRVNGWPFGSVVPYALTPHREPIIFIANIAEHTKNIEADDRVSLLVRDEAGQADDVQARGRLTLMGRAERISAEERDEAEVRYRARHPASKSYRMVHGFAYYRIRLEQLRYIGGFGRIHWLPAEHFADLRDRA